MAAGMANAGTVGALIEAVAAELDAAGLHYGHGTDNPLDEAGALVFSAAGFDHADAAALYARPVDAALQARARALVDARVTTRKPLAYLTGEGWFAGLPFHVNEHVLVPRSPIAELIIDRFEPWVDASRVGRILEIGTGSGCIAVACALAFPRAAVVATDISAQALAVARRNAERHGVTGQVTLVETDHAEGVAGPFDLIVTNPPYVPDAEQAELPAEYSHEPALGLFSGVDGLDSARRILQDAPLLLSEQGALVLEVGAQWSLLEQAFPTLPFTWLAFEAGGEGVALLRRQDF